MKASTTGRWREGSKSLPLVIRGLRAHGNGRCDATAVARSLTPKSCNHFTDYVLHGDRKYDSPKPIIHTHKNAQLIIVRM